MIHTPSGWSSATPSRSISRANPLEASTEIPYQAITISIMLIIITLIIIIMLIIITLIIIIIIITSNSAAYLSCFAMHS